MHAWFGAAQKLHQNQKLNRVEAFAITQLMAGGDSEDLEGLLKNVEVRDDCSSLSNPSFAVEGDPIADVEEVSDDADIYWSPEHDGLCGVAVHTVHSRGDGAAHWYRLVRAPGPLKSRRDGPQVENLNFCAFAHLILHREFFQSVTRANLLLH